MGGTKIRVDWSEAPFNASKPQKTADQNIDKDKTHKNKGKSIRVLFFLKFRFFVIVCSLCVSFFLIWFSPSLDLILD